LTGVLLLLLLLLLVLLVLLLAGACHCHRCPVQWHQDSGVNAGAAGAACCGAGAA
jgi:hypothetical protein